MIVKLDIDSSTIYFTIICCISGLLVTFCVSSLSISVQADSINPGLASKDSAPYGIPYNEWITKWWQWNMGIPSDKHPRIGYTPEKCSINQQGPVWFLADKGESGVEVRTCTIPTGKAILFPLLSGECDLATILSGKNDEDLRRCAVEGNDFSVIGATVDGVKLKNLEQYRSQSKFFNIMVPNDNIFDEKPGTYRAIVDGFFVFLEPLPPGKHIIRFTDSVNNPLKTDYNHNKDTTYNLVVTP